LCISQSPESETFQNRSWNKTSSSEPQIQSLSSSEEPLVIDGVILDFNKANISEKKIVISKNNNSSTTQHQRPNHSASTSSKETIASSCSDSTTSPTKFISLGPKIFHF
jgi:hypothetical protein